MAQKDIDKRMSARRARVEAAKARVEPVIEASKEARPAEPQIEEPLSNFWKLPKKNVPTTLLNSAWTWTLITYVAILAIAVLSIAQNGFELLDQQGNTARIAIAVGLIYPAWRIGALVSKFMKKRGIGANFSIMGAVTASSSAAPKAKKAVKPGSVDARMEERRARLEKARAEGKL